MSKWFSFLCAGGAVLFSGCAGPMFEGSIFEQPPRNGTGASSAASAPVQQQPTNFELHQLSDQIAALSRAQEALDNRLTRLEAQSNASSVRMASGSSDDLVALRRDIQLIRADRETLKREITDDLAGRIEKIAARQQAEIRAASVRSSPSPGTVAPRVSGNNGAPRRSGYEHKVEKGQTLSEIARGYGKSVDSIMKANKLSSPSSIRVGQVLFIPD